MPNILITGSNRGIGLEWVRQYAEDGWNVFATCRHPNEAQDLRKLAEKAKNIRLLRMDVTRRDELNAVSVELMEQPIDLLISNAGVYLEKYKVVNLSCINYEDWLYTFEVNTLGHIRVVQAFLPNLEKSKKALCVITTTHMASIADICDPGAYYYRSSKSALNAAMEGITYELKEKNIGVLLLHPGHVKTRMGGKGTDLFPPESVKGMRNLIQNFSPENSGCFFRYDGVEMPW